MKAFVASMVIFGSTISAHAAELLAWPQFRGPGGSGIAEDQKPPVEFGPEKNVKWKVPVPAGISSPTVAGDKLVLTAFDGGKLYTIAYSRSDGKELWRREAPAKNSRPSAATGLLQQPEGMPATDHFSSPVFRS